MKKRANYRSPAFLYIPAKHYMIDASRRIDQIINLIEDGRYFMISRQGFVDQKRQNGLRITVP